MTDKDDALLASRYGTRRQSMRPWVKYTLIGVGLAALVGWSAWAGFSQGQKPVSWELRSYTVTSPKTVDIAIDLYREGGRAAECSVYAQAHDHTIVGERVVEVPEGAEQLLVTTSVNTQREAVNGVVRNCILTD